MSSSVDRIQSIHDLLGDVPPVWPENQSFHAFLARIQPHLKTLDESGWGVSGPLGSWYEGQLDPRERLNRGQHFTPSLLCDWMLALAVSSPSDRILEPGCGAGAFLLRAYEYLGALGRSGHDHRLNQLVGVELDPRAALLSAAQLMAQSPSSGDFPNVRAANFLTMNFPEEFSDSSRTEEQALFDVVIGNPPYVRHEHVRQSGNTDVDGIKSQLRASYGEYLTEYPRQKKLFQGHVDLFVWFFLKATPLLKPGGRLAFVTSNGWLNTSYGQPLQEFLEYHFDVLALAEPACESWFSDAAINPVVIVLRRKYEVTDNVHQTRFIRLLKPLSSVLPSPEGSGYWESLQTHVQKLMAGKPVDGVTSRLLDAPVEPLEAKGAPLYSWSFQLRAPEPMANLLASTADKWLELGELGQIRYPLKTGINKFFYVTSDVIDAFGIEPEFLVPVVKSTREVTRLVIEPDSLSAFLFSCLLSEEELVRQDKQGALSYIRWGEQQTAGVRQKRNAPVRWPDVASVQGRRAWYQMTSLPTAHLIAPRFFDRRFFFAQCRGEMVEDQTFYGVTLEDAKDHANDEYVDRVAALLNSSVSYLWVELMGRRNLGEGVLQYSRQDTARLPVVDPACIASAVWPEIIGAYRSMTARSIDAVETEMGHADRQALDEAVLRQLMPSESKKAPEYRERVVSSLLELVAGRIDTARSRRAQKVGIREPRTQRR